MGKFLQAIGLEALAEEPIGSYVADVTPPSRSAALGMSPNRALALPAFYRGVSLIAGMGSQLTLGSWRGDQRVTPSPSLVTTPDPWRTRRSFIARTIVCLALTGNAFWLKTRDDNGTILAMQVLDPGTVAVRHKDGIKTYAVTVDGKTRFYSANDVEHLWLLEVPGHVLGLGPVQACRSSLEGIADVRAYADNWFGSADAINGVLTTEQKLDASGVKAYKDAWYRVDEADPRGPGVRVLGHGLSYEPLFLKPEDAQWLEAQAWGVLDVARLLGVPGDYLLAAVEGSSLTYANLEMIDAQFLRTTLFPLYLAPIEEALTACLPRGQHARFDTEHLLRPDAKTRAEIDAIYLAQNVISPKEIRVREGWDGPAPKPKPAPAIAPTEAPA